MAQLTKKEKKLATTMMQDWSLLPEELLEIISMHLENCFDVVHARSVCRSWRSTLPFPACLLRPSYTIPLAPGLPSWVGKDRGILKRVPLFLFRLRTHVDAASPSGYFLGGIGQDKLEDYTNLSSSLQCSVKVNILGFDATMINMIDCQIVPLGHQYRMVGCYRRQWTGFAFFPLNEGGEEFVVLFNHASCLLVFRSPEMSWIFLNNNYILTDLCKDIVTFRGRFYAVFVRGGTVVIDPHSLKVTPLMPLERLNLHYYLVPSGDDELFLVEEIIPCTRVTDFSRWACRVSRLDEEAGKWVVVTDLGDHVLFIADQGCCSCSAKDLPDGCGLNGNSILFTDKPSGETYAYKYGVDTGNGEDELGFWRFSREKRVTILDNFPQVVAFQV